MKERISMKNLELIDGKKINVPDEVDITKGGYFDEMKYELWDTIKKYLALFGIELEELDDELDWHMIKSVQDKIVQVLQEAGVNFKMETEVGREVVNTEFPVVLLDMDIEGILQVALNSSLIHWCTEFSTSGKVSREPHKELTHGGVITFTDSKTGDWLEFTKEDFISGFRLYLAKPTGANILEFIDHELRVNLNAVDSKVADTIIQYALFGKILY